MWVSILQIEVFFDCSKITYVSNKFSRETFLLNFSTLGTICFTVVLSIMLVLWIN